MSQQTIIQLIVFAFIVLPCVAQLAYRYFKTKKSKP